MANAIIQGYLSDNSVDLEKRKKVITALKAGQPESELATMISTKYGDKYGSASAPQMSTPTQSSSPNLSAAAGIAKKIMNPFSAETIGSAAKGLVDFSTNMMPEGGYTDEQVESMRQGFADDRAREATDQRNNQLGIGRAKPQAWEQDYVNNALQNQATNVNPLIDIPLGAAKYAGDLVLGGAQLGKEALDYATSPIVNTFRPSVQSVTEPLISSAFGKATTPEEQNQAFEEFKQNLTKVENAAQQFGYTGAEIASFFLPSAKVAQVGKGVKTALGGGKLAGLGGALATAGTEGAVAGGITALKEGEINQDAITNAALGGALSLGFSGLGAGFRGVKNVVGKLRQGGNVADDLLRMGVDERAVNILDNLPPAGTAAPVTKNTAADFIEAGVRKLENPTGTPDVFEYAGKEVEDFLSNAKKLQKELGEKVAAQKTNFMNLKVNADGIAEKLKKTLESVGVKNTSQLLKSDIGKNTQVINLVKEVDNLLKSSKSKGIYGTVNARKLESITSQIDDVSGLLGTSGLKKSKANTVLQEIKGAINEALGKASPAFGEANQAYAKLMKNLKKVQSGVKVVTGAGDPIVNGGQLLRRSLTRGDKKYTEAIKAIDQIAQDFGIQAPKGLQEKAFLADIAEKYTGTAPVQGAESVVEYGAKKALGGSLGTALEVGGRIKQFVAPSRKIQEQATKIVEVLKKNVQAGKSVTLKPNDSKVVVNLLSALLKSSTTQE